MVLNRVRVLGSGHHTPPNFVGSASWDIDKDVLKYMVELPGYRCTDHKDYTPAGAARFLQFLSDLKN